MIFMRYKNAGTTFLRFVTNHAFGERTDRQTDRILIARPRVCILCIAVKNWKVKTFVRFFSFCSMEGKGRLGR